jgi:hypothetical protein
MLKTLKDTNCSREFPMFVQTQPNAAPPAAPLAVGVIIGVIIVEEVRP